MRVLTHRHHVSWCLRLEDFGIFLSMHVEASDGAVMQAENSVVHKKKRARYRRLELDYGGATCWNQRRLQAARWRREQVALPVHFVEDLPNDVEGRDQIGSSVAHIDS